MEIKLNAGDKINIPENCKATIVDGLIIIEREKEKFKDGDVLSVATSDNKTMPFIYKGVDERGYYKFYVGINYIGDVFVCPGDDARWGCDTPVYATEEEQQRLFDALKERGLRWNAETKELKKIRKRVNLSERYLSITSGVVIEEVTELGDRFDARRYEVGNYYLLSEKEQAEAHAKVIKAIFEKRLKV